MDTRRAMRRLRAHIIYRLDSALGQPPLVQVAVLLVVTVLIVGGFALVRGGPDAWWWAATHFLDSGSMANDAGGHALALLVTVTGILTLSLLTAALASKMGERIAVLRSGLNPVTERGHVLVLGYDPNVPLLARAIARSGRRCTLVVLSEVDKDRLEASLRPAQRITGGRLKVVVRTGDARSEQALLRVSAQWARAVVIVPPVALADEPAVRWTIAALLAMRRMADEGFAGHVIVEARRRASREILELAGEPDVVGPGALTMDIVATDDVIACVLAQSTKDEAIYFVLRRLLAFDGCEPYLARVPRVLVGKSFDEAHARIVEGIAIGVLQKGELTLCPPPGAIDTLAADDQLVVLAERAGALHAGEPLPQRERVSPIATQPAPTEVTVVGCTPTLPHLLRELDAALPERSRVWVAAGASEQAAEFVATTACRRIDVELREGRPSALALGGAMCTSSTVVILGNEDPNDENGDASALAMLLQLRRGMNVSGRFGVRVVTELRDPRSAAHVVPRPGDCVVSSDLVAMLLAQEALTPAIAPIYRELLHPGGVGVALRKRGDLPGATFAEIRAEARARGEIAIGLFPDPRARGHELEIRRARLEEDDVGTTTDAWLNAPRDAVIGDDPDLRVIVLARAG